MSLDKHSVMNRHYNKDTEHFHHSKTSRVPSLSSVSFFTFSSAAITDLTSDAYRFAFSRMAYKGNHTMFVQTPFVSGYFHVIYFRFIHVTVCTILCPQFPYPFTSYGYSGLFPGLGDYEQVFAWTYVFIFLGQIPRNDIIEFYVKNMFNFLRNYQELPWWLNGWESACQCRRQGFNPWSGEIPHAVELLSSCATTTEPVLWSGGPPTTEPMCHNLLILKSVHPPVSTVLFSSAGFPRRGICSLAWRTGAGMTGDGKLVWLLKEGSLKSCDQSIDL